MNASELVALEWLQNKGLIDITYNAHRSPDFETESGSYEVKTLSNGRLNFTAQQTVLFSSDPTIKILVVHKDGLIEESTYTEVLEKYNTDKVTSVGVSNEIYHKLIRFAATLKIESGKLITMSEAIGYLLAEREIGHGKEPLDRKIEKVE